MVNRYRIEAPARGEKVAMAKPSGKTGGFS
jgi:hypothetical protein